MSFSQMLEILKKREKGNVVFVRVGTFYIAVGEDAVLMHKKLDLKCTCFKTNICKVGFPILSLDRYVNKLNKSKYGYVIYDLNVDKTELKEIVRKKGKHNKEIDKNINCLLCKGIKAYPEDDKYLLTLTKYFENERLKLEEDNGKLIQNVDNFFERNE